MDPQPDTRPIGRPNRPRQNETIPWLWEGVLAEEAVTLLSAPEKVGKTTLLSLLLDRRRQGGVLLGRAVQPGRTILCSEEPQRLWDLRQPPLDFGPELIFHAPYGESPRRGWWKRFIDDLLELSFSTAPFDLLVIDTAVSFVPLFERNRRTLRWALGQLRLVADNPAAVLILNQSRTVQRPLAAFADIVLEMAIPRHLAALPTPTRRRTFTGVGRYPGTLQSAVAELNAEGTDYLLVESSAPPHAPLVPVLQQLLAASATPLTRQDLLARWPGAPPRGDTLWRTLKRGLESGLLTATGSGTKTDPFRYQLRSARA